MVFFGGSQDDHTLASVLGTFFLMKLTVNPDSGMSSLGIHLLHRSRFWAC